MKIISLATIVVLAALLLLVTVSSSSTTLLLVNALQKPLSEYRRDWELYKARLNKKYHSESEESYRFRLFVTRLPENNQQLRKIQELNPLANFGPTQFSDWTETELAQRRNKKLAAGKQQQKQSSLVSTRSVDEKKLSEFMLKSATERSINWTSRGAVGFVRNQQSCGDCWAISTVENIAAQWFILGHGALTPLSEQQLTSCDTADYGCDGSDAYSDTVHWIVNKNNGTLDTWRSYPFSSGNGKTGKCKQHDPSHHREIGASGISGGYVIPSHEEEINRVLVETGPVQISIDSGILDSYVGGIITNHQCVEKNVDHEVLLTGVNNEHRPPYWIVKNSWATSWGEDGYFFVAKNSNNNLCIESWPFMWQIDGKKNNKN